MARVDVRSALDKEVEALKTLRESDGSKYRRDPVFTLIKFYARNLLPPPPSGHRSAVSQGR
jgi:hypothetical protein